MMKFKTEWWGIILIAENDDDEAMLTAMSERLPAEADRYDRYDQGKQTLSREDDGQLTLTFDR